jgi:hypothetical protein
LTEKTVKALIIGTLMAVSASSAGAQVGYPPDRSPYRDRDYNRDWTFFGGQFTAERDPVGVAQPTGQWREFAGRCTTGLIYFGVRPLERRLIARSSIRQRLDERVGTERCR